MTPTSTNTPSKSGGKRAKQDTNSSSKDGHDKYSSAKKVHANAQYNDRPEKSTILTRAW